MLKTELGAILGDDHPALAPIQLHLLALANEPETPEMAVAACTTRIEEAGPALRQVLRRAADGAALSDAEATLLFRGVHILGAARDTQACPLLLKLLRRPPETLDDLLGDTITETLQNIIIGVFDGDAEALFDAVNDRDIEEFARSALVSAASFLTWAGQIPLERTAAGLAHLDDERLADDDNFIWFAWAQAVAWLGLRDFGPRVAQACRDGRVSAEDMTFEDFEADLADAEAALEDGGRFERANLGYFRDALEALEGFVSRNDADWPNDARLDEAQPAEPVTNPLRHVGRNDPCPCGSGKKAKKCCLSQA